MRPLIIFGLMAFMASFAYSSSDLIERAEAELEKDLFKRTMLGATSPRFNRKKVTKM